MPATSLTPNIKTEEQAKRVNELAEKQHKRHDAIVRFVNQHAQDLVRALDYAAAKDIVDETDEDEEGNEVSLAAALRDRLHQWNVANHKFVHFISTGTEDTQFPPQD